MNYGTPGSYPPDFGEIYELTPPRGTGQPYASYEVFAFKGDRTGSTLNSLLVPDSSGILFGTTSYGGVAVAAPIATTYSLFPGRNYN